MALLCIIYININTTIELNLSSNDYGYVSIHNIITDSDICDELEHNYYYDKNKNDKRHIHQLRHIWRLSFIILFNLDSRRPFWIFLKRFHHLR